MIETGYDALMHVVCVDLGFCGCLKRDKPLHVDDLIPPCGPVSADQFVEWVFLADNQNPNHEPERWLHIKQAIRASFVEHMNAEVVDATKLRWSDIDDEDEDNGKYRGRVVDDQ